VAEFAPKARNIAHIDIDAAEIGKVKHVTWSHAGDASVALKQLRELGASFKKDYAPWLAHLTELKKNHALNYNRESSQIQPQEVLAILNEITKGKAIIATGVGQHQMWAAQFLDFVNPRTWLTSGSMGTTGFGLPAAIGAQVACPDAIVIDVDGDGSIRMNLGELETATTYNIPVKVLLLNNLGDGMVRQWQTMMYEERFSGSDKTLHRKDFVKAAEADGYGFAVRLDKKADIRKTLEAFVAHEGPAFLEVSIDRDAHVYPMVGPGKGYKDMVTGPYITPRKVDEEEQPKPVDIGATSMF